MGLLLQRVMLKYGCNNRLGAVEGVEMCLRVSEGLDECHPLGARVRRLRHAAWKHHTARKRRRSLTTGLKQHVVVHSASLLASR